jgi:peptide/nickel transport system substrate-binding protein
MKKRLSTKVKAAVCVLLSAGIMMSAAACGANNSSGTKTSGTAAKLVTIAMASDAANLDPVNCKDNADIWLITLFGEGLVKCSDDGKKVEPCLAKSWDISSDNLTYTFHLRDDVKFSNGQKMTADDVVYCLKRARDTKASQWGFSLTSLKDITAKDSTTVVATLT